jgi:hypothetical protein
MWHVHRYGRRSSPRFTASPDVRRLLAQLARYAQRARHADEVDARIHQIHADVTVVLGGEALSASVRCFRMRYGRVVEDHVDDREWSRGRPSRAPGSCTWRSVTNERDDRTRGLRELDADRRRQAPADAAATQRVERAWLARVEATRGSRAGRDRFLHDDASRGIASTTDADE